MFVPNTISVIVAHTDKDASDLFERARFMFNSIPDAFKPSVGRSNVRELFFDRVNSRFFIGSAEAKHFGICVHPNVKVLVENGFPKKISEVGVPTILWDGELISVTPWMSPEPIIVTPNHLILTQNGWKEAGKLTLGDTIAQPIRKITNQLRTVKIKIPLHWRVQKKTKLSYIEEKEVPLTKEFGWIIGLLLADGRIENKYYPNKIVFSVNKKKELEYGNRITKFFKKYPFQSNYGKKVTSNFISINKGTGECIGVYILNSVWGRFFKENFYTQDLVYSKGRLGKKL